jgi:hypothetical protein
MNALAIERVRNNGISTTDYMQYQDLLVEMLFSPIVSVQYVVL